MSASNAVPHPLSGPFAELVGQPRVREFLSAAVSGDSVSQAYLFIGPPGSGKTDAAYALAAAVLCGEGGCGGCDSCIRVVRRTHPDVRYFSPASASGYVVDQVREIVRDTALSPVRGTHKIYIVDRVDRLGASAANAFLKTLEEPPADVLFILLGRTREQVLATIASRCQVVPFRRIPLQEATAMLVSLTGCSEGQGRQALAAAGGSISKARTFMLSTTRRDVRHTVLQVLGTLVGGDDLDVLDAAQALTTVAKAPVDTLRSDQEAQLKESVDYLERSALKALEERQKRELSIQGRDGLLELLNITRSWLRDLLIMVVRGDGRLIVNVDAQTALRRVGATARVEGVTRAITAVDEAAVRIAYHVTPQLVIETMLFDIREVLSCPWS
jgi:DNA polymerase-3 subunit delta'